MSFMHAQTEQIEKRLKNMLSTFKNACRIDNVDEYCSINSCSMSTKNTCRYNVVETRADNC